MKKILILLFWLFPLVVFADPAISNVTYSGDFEKGATITITGTDFGSHADYGNNADPYLCRLWDDFETGTKRTSSGYWDSGFVSPNSVIASTSNRTGSLYYVVQNVGAEAGVAHRGDASATLLYVSAWRWPDPLGPNDGTNRKFWRVYTQGNFGDNFVATLISGGGDGSSSAGNHGWQFEAHTNITHTTNYGSSIHTGWHFYEVIIDKSDSTCKIYLDGVKIASPQGDINGESFSAWNPYDIIYDAFSHEPGDEQQLLDDCYISFTRARIILSDAATWSESVASHRELQLPTAWSTTEITATVNQGSFSAEDTAYLYVVKSDGTVNTNGYEVTIGGESTPPSTPSFTGVMTGSIR